MSNSRPEDDKESSASPTMRERERRINDKEVRPLGLLSKRAMTYHHP
jgi:hypothetical protein